MDKVERGELDQFRLDFIDRITAFESKMADQTLVLQNFGEALESKVEGMLVETRHHL